MPELVVDLHRVILVVSLGFFSDNRIQYIVKISHIDTADIMAAGTIPAAAIPNGTAHTIVGINRRRRLRSVHPQRIVSFLLLSVEIAHALVDKEQAHCNRQHRKKDFSPGDRTACVSQLASHCSYLVHMPD